MLGYAEFAAHYPSYDQTHKIDLLRQQEYSRLDRLSQVYLDYTGGGLYADWQIREHQRLLAERFLALQVAADLLVRHQVQVAAQRAGRPAVGG